MTLERDLHQLVLSIEGVATVYSADPAWLTAVKQAAALLGSSDDGTPFIVCAEEHPDSAAMLDGGQPTLSVRLRIGSDGTVPAPALARNVATAIRAFVSGQRPGIEVRVVVEVSAIAV